MINNNVTPSYFKLLYHIFRVDKVRILFILSIKYLKRKVLKDQEQSYVRNINMKNRLLIMLTRHNVPLELNIKDKVFGILYIIRSNYSL